MMRILGEDFNSLHKITTIASLLNAYYIPGTRLSTSLNYVSRSTVRSPVKQVVIVNQFRIKRRL